MEPNKTEEIIKSRLESREIQPSENAWDRLDAMLSVEEKPKQKVAYWKYIAASIVAIMGIIFWYNQAEEIEGQINNNEFQVVQEEQKETEETLSLETKSIEEIIIENKKEQIAEQKEKVPKNNFKEQLQKSVPKDKIESQPEGVNAETTKANREEDLSSYKYISPEKLLASIEQENGESIMIENKKIINPKNNTLKVNPDALLTAIEDEINDEYRETTFDKLKRKFNEAKSAVANRNYE